jgi:plastocyanin
VRPRAIVLGLAGLLGAAVAVLPGIATGTSPPNTASFTAIDYSWQANGGGGNSATIAQGGTVTISYPSGFSSHNADFGRGAAPTSCTQTRGAVSGGVPPLPHSPTSPGWSGTCKFDTPGTYTFHCDLHPFMTATLTVKALPPPTTSTTTTGTTTGTTTTVTTGTTTTGITTGTTTTGASTTAATPTTAAGTTTTSSAPTSPAPPTEPTIPITRPRAGGAITIASVQRARTINGVAKIDPAGAGGRLDVYAFARTRPARSHASRWTRVGRLTRANLATGRARFSVVLSSAAERILRRRHRLTVVVGVVVASPRAAAAWTIRRIQVLSPT